MSAIDRLGDGRKTAVIGLGYARLPAAAAVARARVPAIAFDIARERVHELVSGRDRPDLHALLAVLCKVGQALKRGDVPAGIELWRL